MLQTWRNGNAGRRGREERNGRERRKTFVYVCTRILTAIKIQKFRVFSSSHSRFVTFGGSGEIANNGYFFPSFCVCCFCSLLSGRSDHVSTLSVESYRRISASVVAIEAFGGSFFISIFIRVLCRVVGLSTRESSTISYWPVPATGGRHIGNNFAFLLNLSFLVLVGLSKTRAR